MGKQILRRISQAAFVAAAAWTGLSLARGLGLTSVEKYCPFGGVATAWSVITGRHMTCATGEFNITILLALLGLTLLLRKSFCSWVCPVGTISELLARPGRLLRNRITRSRSRALGLITPNRRLDSALRWLRLPVLVAILYFTISLGELIFRPFCPYYVMYSFHGHEVQVWSYLILAVLLLGMVLIPMIWCRYLCPLGGVLQPLSRISLVRVSRSQRTCTSCGACDRACPQGLAIQDQDEVRGGDCTLCLECRTACPVPGTLEMTLPRRPGRSLPTRLVPAGLLVFAVAGLLGGARISLPSFTRDFGDVAGVGRTAHAVLLVPEVRCVDTARKASDHLAGIKGMLRFQGFGSHNRVEVDFDATRTDLQALIKALEGPRWDPDEKKFLFNQFTVLEVIESR